MHHHLILIRGRDIPIKRDLWYTDNLYSIIWKTGKQIGVNFMEIENQSKLRNELEKLRLEHTDLDRAIDALEESGRADQLQLTRLKKKKLALKDKITKIEDQLFPDIIA